MIGEASGGPVSVKNADGEIESLSQGHRHLLTRRKLLAAALPLTSGFVGGLAFAPQTGSGVWRVPFAAASSSPTQAFMSDTLPHPDWSTLEVGPQVRIKAIVDGDTVELERGPDVRMVGTQAPKLPLGRDHVAE